MAWFPILSRTIENSIHFIREQRRGEKSVENQQKEKNKEKLVRNKFSDQDQEFVQSTDNNCILYSDLFVALPVDFPLTRFTSRSRSLRLGLRTPDGYAFWFPYSLAERVQWMHCRAGPRIRQVGKDATRMPCLCKRSRTRAHRGFRPIFSKLNSVRIRIDGTVIKSSSYNETRTCAQRKDVWDPLRNIFVLFPFILRLVQNYRRASRD